MLNLNICLISDEVGVHLTNLIEKNLPKFNLLGGLQLHLPINKKHRVSSAVSVILAVE